jgi:hypothetical protein
MNQKQSIKLVKNSAPRSLEVEAENQPPIDPNRWSAAVRSWVDEFQQKRQVEILPAFDTLFKEPL